MKIRVGTKSLEQLYEEDPRLLEVQGVVLVNTSRLMLQTLPVAPVPAPLGGDFAFVAKHFVSIQLLFNTSPGIVNLNPPLQTAQVSHNCMLLVL